VQLLKETRIPIAATTKHGERVDYEYERNGTASLFMFAEPLSGHRPATARPQRTATARPPPGHRPATARPPPGYRPATARPPPGHNARKWTGR